MVDQLIAVHHPVVGRELHRETVDQRGEAHRRGVGIGAGELAGLDADRE